MTLKRLRMLLPMLMLCLILAACGGESGGQAEQRLRLPPM